ncbi:MAG: hypothetical protein ABIR91_00425 [Candidatus Saccharimonadales bacterium]
MEQEVLRVKRRLQQLADSFTLPSYLWGEIIEDAAEYVHPMLLDAIERTDHKQFVYHACEILSEPPLRKWLKSRHAVATIMGAVFHADNGAIARVISHEEVQYLRIKYFQQRIWRAIGLDSVGVYAAGFYRRFPMH